MANNSTRSTNQWLTVSSLIKEKQHVRNKYDHTRHSRLHWTM